MEQQSHYQLKRELLSLSDQRLKSEMMQDSLKKELLEKRTLTEGNPMKEI